MSRAKRIEEAARNVLEAWKVGSLTRHERDELEAALAAPEDEGDVVERAALVLADHMANGAFTGNTLARALASAGLLAGPCQVCEHRRTSVREIGGGR